MKTNYEINDEMLNEINGGAACVKEKAKKDDRPGKGFCWHWGQDWGEDSYWH